MKRRMILLLMVMVAALLMASGAAMAADPNQEKTTQEEKKAKGKKSAPEASAAEAQKAPQQLNTVQCPNQPNNETCIGTDGKDLLVGTEEFENIQGGKGADTYDGKDGGDDLFDASRKSSDTYIIPETEFNSAVRGGINVTDRGGASDVLDLSAYSSTQFALVRFGNLLQMEGPGERDVGISSFFNQNTIDKFKFSDTTLTAKQMKERIRRV
jgi:Ca2+-binding RTX toxin-like protein